jgi:hypothetical protein
MTKQITDQELFDECATHVIQQGKKASNGWGCAYRTKDGRSCAIGGPLANHGLYTPELDDDDMSMGISNLTSLYLNADQGEKLAMLGMALAAWGVEERQLDLLEDIQNAHDVPAEGAGFIEAFKGRMRLVATGHGLNAAVVA